MFFGFLDQSISNLCWIFFFQGSYIIVQHQKVKKRAVHWFQGTTFCGKISIWQWNNPLYISLHVLMYLKYWLYLGCLGCNNRYLHFFHYSLENGKLSMFVSLIKSCFYLIKLFQVLIFQDSYRAIEWYIVNPRLSETMLHNALVLKSKMETTCNPSYLINLRTKLYIYITEKLQAQDLQYFLQHYLGVTFFLRTKRGGNYFKCYSLEIKICSHQIKCGLM